MATNTVKDHQVNTYIKGMNMDTAIEYADTSGYRYAENIRIVTDDDGTTGVLQNSDGVEPVQDIYLDTDSTGRVVEKIIHTAVIRNYALIFTEHEASATVPYTYTRLIDGVVYTKTYTSPFNNIYRLNFDVPITTHTSVYEEPLFQVLILRGSLDIAEPVSSVTKWEDDDNIKIYWADGVNSPRVISVVPELTFDSVTYQPYDSIEGQSDRWDYYLDIDPSSIDITPSLTEIDFTFERFGLGGLEVGNYQYAYQLYTDFGGETMISPVSDMISMAKSSESDSSSSYEGDSAGAQTTKSVVFKLQSTSLRLFNKVRLIRIFYPNFTDSPIIHTIFETEITSNIVYLEDVGGDPLDEETTAVAENIDRYQFVAKVLESKDDILFAGDITEITGANLDLESFDARAYRYDANGDAELLHSVTGAAQAITRAGIVAGTETVDEKHDCIPSVGSTFDSTAYKYGLTVDIGGVPTPVLGGAGPNISYEIVTVKLVEDERALVTQPNGVGPNGADEFANQLVNQNYTDIYSNRYGIGGLYSYGKYTYDGTLDIGQFKYTPTDGEYEISVKSHTGFLNYQNPFISNKFKSLQRDETYRFGIVFYNNKNVATPAKWIADIKMPSNSELPYLEWSGSDYHYIDNNGNDATITAPSCVTSILGIKFTVNTAALPDGCVAYEIVRVKRTGDDRYIKYSVVLDNVYTVDYSVTNSEVYPLWYLNSSGRNAWSYLNTWDQYADNEKGSSAGGFSHRSEVWAEEDLEDISASWRARPTMVPRVHMLISPETILNADDVIRDINGSSTSLKGSIYLGSKFNWTRDTLEATGRVGSLITNPDSVLSNDRIMATYVPNDYRIEPLAGTVLNGDYAAPAYAPGSLPSPPVILPIGETNWFTIYYDDDNSRTYNYFVETGLKGVDTEGVVDESFFAAGNSLTVSKYYTPSTNVRFIKDRTNHIYEGGAHNSTNTEWVPSTGGDYKTIGGVVFSISDAKRTIDVSAANDQVMKIGSGVRHIAEGHLVSVGGYSFYNKSIVNTRRQAGTNASPPLATVRTQDGWFYYTSPYGCPHGPGIVVDSQQVVEDGGTNYNVRGVIAAKGESPLFTVNGITIYNVLGSEGLQYGGKSYAMRQYSVYESVGTYTFVSDGGDINAFGGDIYVTLFDYAASMTSTWGEFNREWSAFISGSDYMHSSSFENSLFSGAYIPMETSVNTRLMHGIQFSRTLERQIHTEVGEYNGYSQNETMYQYNNAYSRMSDMKHFLSKLDVSEDNKRFDTRILHSQPKTNDEASDNWIQFRQADHIDLDTRYGPVTSLKTFKNRLFFWQEEGFGVAAVNERSLISDDNISPLLLGTGDVLTRYDYITNQNGSKYDCSGNIVTTDGGIYWYDQLKNEIMIYSNATQSLSKGKGIQTYLNASNDMFLNRICTVYDPKYNEVMFTFRTLDYESPYYS